MNTAWPRSTRTSASPAANACANARVSSSASTNARTPSPSSAPTKTPARTRGGCVEVSCIGCGICQKVCPAGAITVTDNLSHIDESVCLSCGQCAVKCPRHAICDLRGILTEKR
ncbi:MAG: 4Fe-4S dicluster domain-containing protein [Acutalibacteraceae bacterium]